MSAGQSKIIAGSILACERVSAGVVITFADQESFLFDAGFLYESRLVHGKHVPNAAEDDTEGAAGASKDGVQRER